jgi:uncharacterized protein (DUF58 family)
MKLSLSALADRLPVLMGVERRRAGQRHQPITLHQRRIFILPTGYGVLYAVMVAVMTLTATNYNNNMGFALAFILASLGMVSILHTYRNIAGLILRAGRAPAVFRGDMARFNITVENHSAQTRYSVYLQGHGQTATVADIAAHSSTSVQLSLPAKRRGRLPLEIITVHSCYPLGLFRAWSYVRLDMQCLVYPRPADTARPPASTGSDNGRRPRQTSGTEDFLGLRAYAHGDSLRHVHWKSLAREQELLTKQFGDTETATRWLDWNLLAGMDNESRLSQLCRWVLDAEQAGVRYGLRIPGQSIAPNRGNQHRHHCLQALALFGTTHD